VIDAGTFAFGDIGSGRFGLAHLAYAGHGVAAVFAGGELAAQTTDGAQVEIAELEPARRWRATFAGAGGGFDVEFEALSDPVAFADGDDQLCRVTGSVTASGATEPIACLGQRAGAASGPPPKGTLLRWVGAWLGEGEAILVRARRAPGADADAETVEAYLVEGETSLATRVADPRLSTQYDAKGRHVRGGLELWVGEEDDYARRAAGQVVCATRFDFGEVRLDLAFMHWRMHGRDGAGVYDLLGPA
jgi:hypothetical protein